jgi:peptide/nickel transport system substrate-binding protein
VQWSDGRPFTAKDVVFTMNFGKTCAGFDQISLISPGSNIASIVQTSDYQVAVHLKSVDTTILPTLLSNISGHRHVGALMTGPNWFDQSNRGTLNNAWLHWVGMRSMASLYYFYYAFMSQESYVPTGQDASVAGNNLERWYSPDVTNLLHQFKQTTNLATQKAIITKIEKIQLDQVPYIPLNYGANWDIYSTLHFTGFATPDNYYAHVAPSNYPDSEVVMLTLKPVQ